MATKNVRHPRRKGFERLEPRRLLGATPMEIYAMRLVNTMRSDPPAFAEVLDDMRLNRASSGHGYANTDPVWVDLRQAISVSLMPSNVPAAISLLRSTDPLPPLAWEDSLFAESNNHNQWMQSTCFAHSTPESAAASPCLGQLPGMPYNPQRAASNPDRIGENTLGEWSSGAFNENIGYQSGPTMPATRQAYAVGSDGHRQRQAYYDVVNFVLEFNSGSLGHLEALLHPRRDAIGIAYETIDGFSQVSSDTNFLTTHTLSRNASIGGYLTGVMFDDQNRNGWFDLGEQIGMDGPGQLGDRVKGCVLVTSIDATFSEHFCTDADQAGRLSTFLPAGEYWVDGGVTRQLVEFQYQTQNQNVDVSSLLRQRSIVDVGYQAIVTTEVDGDFTLPAWSGYQTLMVEAMTDSTLQINTANHIGSELWITNDDRIDLGVHAGNQITASLTAGETYAIIASTDFEALSFSISIEGNVRPILTNVLDFADVDQSGTATPLDALIVINQIARQSTIDLPDQSPYYVDTNGDGQLTPRDALRVLNAIGARQANAEPESVMRTEAVTGNLPRRLADEVTVDQVFAVLGRLF